MARASVRFSVRVFERVARRNAAIAEWSPARQRLDSLADAGAPIGGLSRSRVSSTSPDGAWQVVVSEADGSLHLSRLTPPGRFTRNPQGWTAQAGWFAFVESESRVWAYDGDRALYLMTATPGSSDFCGPRRFPCAVPTQVFSRLSEPAQRAIEPHD